LSAFSSTGDRFNAGLHLSSGRHIGGVWLAFCRVWLAFCRVWLAFCRVWLAFCCLWLINERVYHIWLTR
jgi:hypothetical protein